MILLLSRNLCFSPISPLILIIIFVSLTAFCLEYTRFGSHVCHGICVRFVTVFIMYDTVFFLQKYRRMYLLLNYLEKISSAIDCFCCNVSPTCICSLSWLAHVLCLLHCMCLSYFNGGIMLLCMLHWKFAFIGSYS